MSCKKGNQVAIQGTNDSSIVSKHSMVKLGYFSDGFLSHFVDKPSRRAPLINRGYYVRAKAIDAVLSDFLFCCAKKGTKGQILSLGAGFDTLYFRIKERWKDVDVSVFEIDFPDVVKRKAHRIQSQAALLELLPERTSFLNKEIDNGCIVLDSQNYKLIGLDLNYLDFLEHLLMECCVDVTATTLLLSECAITYMDETKSSALIKWASAFFQNAQIAVYEQISPNDGFGQVMIQHFQKLGSQLRSVNNYPDVLSQKERYLTLGWNQCNVIDMNTFYQKNLSPTERQRVDNLELFEEFEEFHQKCGHYVLICASNGELPPGPSWACDNSVVAHPGFLVSPVYSSINSIQEYGKVARFGHRSISLTSNLVVTIGGFGCGENGGHRRLSNIHIVNLEMQKDFFVFTKQAHLQDGRLFLSISGIADQTLILIGGRTSPKSACSDILRIKLKADSSHPNDGDFEIDKVAAVNSEGQESRWRHTASVVKINNKEKIVIFGGRNQACGAMNDCHVLNPETWEWSKINAIGSLPRPRHSHAACTWNQSIIISGGLSDDSMPLNSIYRLDCIKNQWSVLDFTLIHPRYSHTAHEWQDKMFLIGGVNTLIGSPPAVAIVDLLSGKYQELSLPVMAKPTMFSKHSSMFLPQNESILILGGGGTCFSFGTHLNQTAFSVDLTELCALFEK